MEHSFIVKTVATVTYENWVETTDEEISKYRERHPEYAESTDEEIVHIMYADGELEVDDCYPVDWRDERVAEVRRY
jgi:hypothetical protein